MGFIDQNPTDGLVLAAQRGEEAFVILAEVDDVVLTTPIVLGSPIAGIAIGANSDYDQAGFRYDTLAANGDSQPQTRVAAIGAPLLLHMPPPQAQPGLLPTLTLITGDAGGKINALRPFTLPPFSAGFISGRPFLELIVYLKPPAFMPLWRRDRMYDGIGTVATPAGVEIGLAYGYAYGRKTASVMVNAAASAGGGTINVYQYAMNRFYNTIISTIATVAVPAGGGTFPMTLALSGAQAIAVTYQSAANSTATGIIEVRD